MALRTLCCLMVGGTLLLSLLGASTANQQEPAEPQEPKAPSEPRGPEEPRGPADPREPKESGEADEFDEACCFTNPYFEGQCSVSPGESESCESILEYLNTANTEGKTYCDASLTRGGWKSVTCEEEGPE